MTTHVILVPQSLLHSLLLVHHEMINILLHLPATEILCLPLNQQDLDRCAKIAKTMIQNKACLRWLCQLFCHSDKNTDPTICFSVTPDLDISQN